MAMAVVTGGVGSTATTVCGRDESKEKVMRRQGLGGKRGRGGDTSAVCGLNTCQHMLRSTTTAWRMYIHLLPANESALARLKSLQRSLSPSCEEKGRMTIIGRMGTIGRIGRMGRMGRIGGTGRIGGVNAWEREGNSQAVVEEEKIRGSLDVHSIGIGIPVIDEGSGVDQGGGEGSENDQIASREENKKQRQEAEEEEEEEEEREEEMCVFGRTHFLRAESSEEDEEARRLGLGFIKDRRSDFDSSDKSNKSDGSDGRSVTYARSDSVPSVLTSAAEDTVSGRSGSSDKSDSSSNGSARSDGVGSVLVSMAEDKISVRSGSSDISDISDVVDSVLISTAGEDRLSGRFVSSEHSESSSDRSHRSDRSGRSDGGVGSLLISPAEEDTVTFRPDNCTDKSEISDSLYRSDDGAGRVSIATPEDKLSEISITSASPEDHSAAGVAAAAAAAAAADDDDDDDDGDGGDGDFGGNKLQRRKRQVSVSVATPEDELSEISITSACPEDHSATAAAAAADDDDDGGGGGGGGDGDFGGKKLQRRKRQVSVSMSTPDDKVSEISITCASPKDHAAAAAAAAYDDGDGDEDGGDGGDGGDGDFGGKKIQRRKRRVIVRRRVIVKKRSDRKGDVARKGQEESSMVSRDEGTRGSFRDQEMMNAWRVEKRLPVRRSIGVDLGNKRTGIAVTYGGMAPRSLEVVEGASHAQLAQALLRIAQTEGADEFVVGLPLLANGQQSEQARKTRLFVNVLAVAAAQRGWRVLMFDEYSTTKSAMDYMLATGSNRRSRKTQIDSVSAAMLLCFYYESFGRDARMVWPKDSLLQEKVRGSLPQEAVDGFDFLDDM